jgi:hypothetical protein
LGNIKTVFGLVEPQNVFKTSKATPEACPDPSLLYGVELEIENASFDDATTGWQAEEDGSLRNHGVEFVSRPMTYSMLSWALLNLFKNNGYTTENYSERCSVHVHANCQDMTLSQLASLILIYQVFEDVLFTWIDSSPDQPHRRRDNIFCVPLSETQVSYAVTRRFAKGNLDGIRQWHKYTALNLLPLETQGTVEFRHMGGECDAGRILTWCRLIGGMFAKAKELPFEEVLKLFTELNSTSDYDRVLDSVFKGDANCLRAPRYREELENGVLNMKYSLFEQPDKKKVTLNAWFAGTDPVPVGGWNLGQDDARTGDFEEAPTPVDMRYAFPTDLTDLAADEELRQVIRNTNVDDVRRRIDDALQRNVIAALHQGRNP